jgi:hypothetical protein
MMTFMPIARAMRTPGHHCLLRSQEPVTTSNGGDKVNLLGVPGYGAAWSAPEQVTGVISAPQG